MSATKNLPQVRKFADFTDLNTYLQQSHSVIQDVINDYNLYVRGKFDSQTGHTHTGTKHNAPNIPAGAVVLNAEEDGTVRIANPSALNFTTGLDVASTGGKAVISVDISELQVASASQLGILSAADWSTFNNKQPAGSYVTYTGAVADVDLGLFDITATVLNCGSFYVNYKPAPNPESVHFYKNSAWNGCILGQTSDDAAFEIWGGSNYNTGAYYTIYGADYAEEGADGGHGDFLFFLGSATAEFRWYNVASQALMKLGDTGVLTLPKYTTAGILHNAVTTGIVSSSLIVPADIAVGYVLPTAGQLFPIIKVAGFTSADIDTALGLVPATGAAVFFPAGTYAITKQILVPYSNVTLYGEGSSTIIKPAVWASWATPAHFIYATSKNNVTIKDMYVDGTNCTGQAFDCISLYNSHDCKIFNVTVYKSDRYGIYAGQCNGTIISGCTADANGDAGIYSYGYNGAGYNTVIVGNVTKNHVSPSLAGIQIYYQRGGVVSGNTSYNDRFGLYSSNNSDVEVTGNSFYYSTVEGAYFYGGSVVFNNNEIVASLIGLQIDGVYGGSFCGNVIKNCSQRGISITYTNACRDLTISGNSFFENGNTYDDIYIGAGTTVNRVLIANNIFTSASGKAERAINILGGTDITVVGNSSYLHDTCGINIDAGATNVRVGVNNFMDATKLTNTCTTSVVDNYDGTNFEFNQPLKLGTLAGVLFGTAGVVSALSYADLKTGAGYYTSGDSPSFVSITATGLTVNGATVLNEAGADSDTRIEGVSNTHLIFADASANNVGIGSTNYTPLHLLHVQGESNSHAPIIALTDNYAGHVQEWRFQAFADTLNIRNGTTNLMAFDVSGNATLTGILTISSNKLNIATAKTPASQTDTGSVGDICWDASYIYVCTATNYWERTAIAAW